jgi:hypothetical protein
MDTTEFLASERRRQEQAARDSDPLKRMDHLEAMTRELEAHVLRLTLEIARMERERERERAKVIRVHDGHLPPASWSTMGPMVGSALVTT